MNLFETLEMPPLEEDLFKKISLYTDGGSRGNPGIAGCGGAIYDADQKEIGQFSKFLGLKTNNYAEYQGLIEGLKLAQKLKATHIQVFMDSKLAIEQMKGSWKVKHPQIKLLFQEAKSLEGTFQLVNYQHVLRHKNTRADSLANSAMDKKA